MFDREQVKVDWIFRIDATQEIAVTGLSITGVTTGFDAEAYMTALEEEDAGLALIAAMAELLGTTGINLSDYADLTDVRFAAQSVLGAQIGDPKFYSSTVSFAGVQDVLPQDTIVLSLRSDTTLGRANYGRMYLPYSRLTLENGTPFATSAAITAVANAGATFLNSVNTAMNVYGAVGVANMSAVGTGTTKTVTRAACGSVNDSQRRRRNRLPETYAFADLV